MRRVCPVITPLSISRDKTVKRLCDLALSLSLFTACNERRIRRNVGEKASLNPLPFARGERTVALPSVPLDLSLGWNLELSRHSLSFSLLPFGSRTRGRWLFRFPSRFFRYARAEDVKRLEVFEEFVTKRNGKKNGRES